jgi:predicted regulator of Ras-like GTPase activity (Roadblock/LC7/MglB family)
MLGFIKNIFGSRHEKENVFQQPELHKAGTEAMPAFHAARTEEARTAPPGFRPSKLVPARRLNTAEEGDSLIEIPLSSVLSNLPMELKARVRQTEVGDATLSISLNMVLSQISTGAVRLSFGDLRGAAPELFSPAEDCDQAPVALPLQEILSRVDATLLSRRQNQKHIEVPPEISSPFADRGNIVTVAAPAPAPAAAPVRQVSVRPQVQPMDEATPFVQKTAPKPAKSTSMPKPSQPKPVAPKAPAPVQAPIKARVPVDSIPAQPIAHKPLPKKVETPQPFPMRNSVTPPPMTPPPAEQEEAIPVSSALRSLGTSIGLTAPANSPTTRSGQVRNAASKVAANQPVVTVPLKELTESWPDSIRQEIAQLKLGNATVAIPLDTLESTVKGGRVAFPWKTIRAWIQPAILPSVSAHDAVVLELPLKVIAPLFLARKNDLSQPKQRVAIDEKIPNLFFGFPQAESAAAALEPAPQALTPTPAQPSAAMPKSTETNYYVWADSSDSARVDETEFKRQPIQTNFLSRYATPNEVVARAAELPGVVGSLVALPDGLMVASKLPAELNGDTLAAFLPQIFGKVSQCTKELRMGELNNLNFTVGNVPWKIFRVNAIFFAAFGRAGEGLPTAQLASLAAQLDRKKQ